MDDLPASVASQSSRPVVVYSPQYPGAARTIKSTQQTVILTSPLSEPHVNGTVHVESLVSAELPVEAFTQEPLVAVIGCGYVGEHLVAGFSKHYHVIGYDVSLDRVQSLKQTYGQKNDRLTFTTAPDDLSKATHFLVSVPTLLREDKTIDTSYINAALITIEYVGRPGSTVVVESSVAVGMTRQLLGPLAQRKGFFAGMSPERVDPGRVVPSAHEIPKIVSGLDDMVPGSLEAIVRLYSPVFDTIVPVNKPEVAEMMKLYENCQRMMCIAFANEMADACVPFGVDPYEVCRAAATKPFGYMPFVPSLGVGGHCIPVNPYYLLSNSDFPLLRACTEKMWQRPAEVGQRAMRLLFGPEEENKTFSEQAIQRTDSGIDMSFDEEMEKRNNQVPAGNGSSNESGAPQTASGAIFTKTPRVLVVGMGFKAGQSVLSNSPGQKLAQYLADTGRVDTMFADPLVKQEAIPLIPRLPDMAWAKGALETFDMIIVAVRQVGIDFSVLQTLENVDVQIWCP
ncbi:hypothetical protein LQW54_002628 [Pestalotiopsis sp. IQ-011]